jgi:hypothetical protein
MLDVPLPYGAHRRPDAAQRLFCIHSASSAGE